LWPIFSSRLFCFDSFPIVLRSLPPMVLSQHRFFCHHFPPSPLGVCTRLGLLPTTIFVCVVLEMKHLSSCPLSLPPPQKVVFNPFSSTNFTSVSISLTRLNRNDPPTIAVIRFFFFFPATLLGFSLFLCGPFYAFWWSFPDGDDQFDLDIRGSSLRPVLFIVYRQHRWDAVFFFCFFPFVFPQGCFFPSAGPERFFLAGRVFPKGCPFL